MKVTIHDNYVGVRTFKKVQKMTVNRDDNMISITFRVSRWWQKKQLKTIEMVYFSLTKIEVYE